MIDYTAIGRLIVEEVLNEPGICFYPASFKPPHKGHFKAAKDIASRNYVTEVIVIISRKPKDGITPEQSLVIWNMYLNAEPNPKIKPRIAEADSPVEDIFGYLASHEDVSAVYVAGGDDEADDQGYLQDIQGSNPTNVKTISIHEKDGKVNSPYVRGILFAANQTIQASPGGLNGNAEQYIKVAQKEYNEFKGTIPEATYNKGGAPKIFKMLVQTIQAPPAPPPEEELAPEEQPAPAPTPTTNEPQ
jgi:hypothetical protein